MLNNLKIVELLNARFCHDLAGPLGAISNGVEFLNNNNEDMKIKAQNLIQSSADQAVSRLQFFRQLYGSTPEHGEANLGNIKELTNQFLRNSKIDITWDIDSIIQHNIKISHRVAKLILNLIFIASNALIKGGEIKIQILLDTDLLDINITAKDADIKFDEEFFEILKGKINLDNLSSRNIQIYYTYLVGSGLDTEIALNHQHSELKMNTQVRLEEISD